jgi:Bestrophin, RFP-TM, chloride channel
VWIYLFFLPFQLIGEFGYYTISGVAIAAFIYLGFLAAGEEIEQPFGVYSSLCHRLSFRNINLCPQGTTMLVSNPRSITSVADH